MKTRMSHIAVAHFYWTFDILTRSIKTIKTPINIDTKSIKTKVTNPSKPFSVFMYLIVQIHVNNVKA